MDKIGKAIRERQLAFDRKVRAERERLAKLDPRTPRLRLLQRKAKH
jgi:hypothetical protein